MTRRVWAVCALLVTVGLTAGTMRAQGQETGIVTGRVTDAVRGEALPGALVRVDGTAISGAADRNGAFRLVGVPAGRRSVVVSFLGRKDATLEVEVRAGQTVDLPVTLEADYAYSETVTVSGESLFEGQARALNQQRTALNITNVISADQIGSFPDKNAADAATRVPGVSIARDQGEGRYVLIRGTEARLNSMMIDGERIPAPEGDLRQVALDAVPADQLQAIEVSKALTPDMDGDSIGGAVNLVTKQAVTRPMALFSIGGGYHALQQSSEQLQFNGTLGRRLSKGRVGLLVGISGSNLNRGSENFEAEYDDGDLADLQLRDYVISRERYGVNFTADVRATDSSLFTVRGIFNEFKDYEINNRIRFRPPNRRIEHVLKNRNQNQHIRSLSFGGQHTLLNGAALDYRLSWAESEENQPDRVDTIFRQTNVSFSPNVSASFIDPENIQPNPSVNNAASARLNAWESELFDTTDRDVTASFNFQVPLRTSGTSASFLKIGGKFKDKSKQRDFQLLVGEPTSTVSFPTLQDTGFDNSRFLDFFPAGYAPFPGILPDASRAMFGALPASNVEIDHEGDAESYEATERVGAGYAMIQWFVNPKLTIVPGVRFESTKVDYTGFEVLYDGDGDYASTRPVTGGDSYTTILPGLNVRYALDDQTNLRAAVTRTLARPNYFDLVPYQLVFQEDGEIARGNSSLKPTSSTNLDLLVERYFRSVGVVSGGFFYKNLSDYIYTFRFQETNFGDVYGVSQPQNGESASLWGLEFAVQNQLRFLPAPFDGLGVYANYTFTDSSASFPDRSADANLPGQSQHIGNFALSYEKYGFSAKASWNFHGRYIDEAGEDAAEDVYYDNHTQVDLNVSQRITKNVRAYADFVNLTNAPLRYYIGVTTRPIQQEYYRWWAFYGLKINW